MEYHLNETELYLFNTGENCYAYRVMGAHKVENGAYRFAVWAPNAKAVSVVGSFNGWNGDANPMRMAGTSGVWEAVVENAKKGDVYKFAVTSRDGHVNYKADPYAFYAQMRPETASIVWGLEPFKWSDGAYMSARGLPFKKAMSVYEAHAGSWKAGLNYRQLAQELVRYAANMGYTHIELMPVCEYPYDMSWGYQITGYYAITSRYGEPEDFKYFINCAHEAGLGVIADWVPAHFTRDAHGLARFDGEAEYEHPDTRRSDQPQWGTLLFNYEKAEVQSFLISNAVYLLKEYHIDGLRVDAVSCMLYLDYGRENGEWLPNEHGGNTNLSAVAFLRKLSRAVGRECPGALLIAEESTAFPLVTAPPEDGGLGFHLKWNMGWMNDTLSYMSMDSLFRKWHHSKLTFPMCYAFSENYILPFSHDEVVHGKRSLIGRMPGIYEEKFLQLKLLFMYQFAQPGKKLMFMGCEFGQFIEWNHEQPLDWMLLDYPQHSAVQRFVRELNALYVSTPALYEMDCGWEGFEWVSVDDADHSVIAFIRRDSEGGSLLCVFNFTPVPQNAYRVRFSSPVILSSALSNQDPRFCGHVPPPRAELMSMKDHEGDYIDLFIPGYGGAYYHLNFQPVTAPLQAPKIQTN